MPYKDPFQLIFEVLPFFSISDSVTIYADLGLNMVGASKYNGNKVADAGVGWHFNPYVGIGQEWGPTFFAGFKVWSSPSWGTVGGSGTAGVTYPTTTNKAIIHWEVPIALHIGF